jgi:rare lipoprotein A (peptidoglycan hydrolase)
VKTGEFAGRGRCGRSIGLVVLGAAGLLAACTNNVDNRVSSRTDAAKSAAADVPPEKQIAKREPRKPAAAEKHAGRDFRFSAVGLASWYGAGFHGRRTANGETFDMNSLTAAHRTLPLPCDVRVTNLANHRSLVVRVNDRGPFVGNRAIDVSAKTAQLLGFYDRGVAKVKIDYLGRAPKPARKEVTASAVYP